MLLVLAMVVAVFLPAHADGAGEPQSSEPSLEQRAAEGDAAAMVELGERYRSGNGVPVDVDKALAWFAAASAKGDINGTYYLGLVYSGRPSDGDQEKARETLRRAIDLCEEEANRATCNPLYVYRQLGVVQKDHSLYSDAITSVQKALSIAENPAAPDDAAAALLYEDLGIIYDVLRDGESALSAYEKAEALHRKLGTTDPQTLGNLLLNKANSLDEMGRHEDSIRVNEQALAILVPSLGTDSPPVGYIYNNIGWSLMGLERYDEAIAEYEKALPIIARSLGPSADKVGYVLNNMGIIRERQGRHEEAIRLNIRALAIYSLYDDSTLAPKRWALQSLVPFLSRAWQGRHGDPLRQDGRQHPAAHSGPEHRSRRIQGNGTAREVARHLPGPCRHADREGPHRGGAACALPAEAAGTDRIRPAGPAGWWRAGHGQPDHARDGDAEQDREGDGKPHGACRRTRRTERQGGRGQADRGRETAAASS